MKQNIIIRRRKSAKHGVTYEYRFETASIGGQLNVSELARVCDMSRTTVYKYIELIEG